MEVQTAARPEHRASLLNRQRDQETEAKDAVVQVGPRCPTADAPEAKHKGEGSTEKCISQISAMPLISDIPDQAPVCLIR